MSMPKTPKGAKTKQRILEASISLIKQKGFNQVTLQDMCKASKVAPGTFYHYFTSHTDILIEILRVEGKELVAYYESIKSIASPLQKLQLILSYQLEYFEKKGKEVVSQLYQLELSTPASSTDQTFSIEEILPVRNIIEELYAEAQQSGELPTTIESAYASAVCVSLLLYYSMQWLRSPDTRPLAEYVSEPLRLFLGLAKVSDTIMAKKSEK